MKKKSTFFFSTACVAAVAILCSVSFSTKATNVSSITELAASAGSYCASCGDCSTDCKSDASGNIYPHYVATDYPVETLN